MNLDEFLYKLHYDIDHVSPPDWEVDWNDAPLPYKLYQNLPTIPLSSEVPLKLEPSEKELTLEDFGAFLWYVYGLNHVSQTVYPETEGVMQALRRFVPSGGGLYPNELYVYVKMECLARGIYHYDVAHHRLVLLREGNFDDYLEKALGNQCDLSSCFGTVFISTMFWKNFFKYNNFSYRLQGLDAGAIIGQIEEAAKRCRYETKVCYQYLDRAVNHLLGLNEQEESVYAVIPIGNEPIAPSSGDEHITANRLCQELEPIAPEHYIHSKTVLEFPKITKMNEAAMLEEHIVQPSDEKREPNHEGGLPLPHVERLDYDFAEACHNRHSPGMDFTMGTVTQDQLGTLFKGVIHSSNLSIYGCFYNVEGLEDGTYKYEPETHSLHQIKKGDFRTHLQSGMSAHNLNLYQTPICLHIVGSKHAHKDALGYRGYRIQQMEAGIILQKMLLRASALRMNGHPLLGFNVKLCDELYGFQKDETCLIQVPIGPSQARISLRGSLL
ncbi:SagB family peptide dehydrogenase [Pseudalkalibacillus sp. SCS-8]|uniref:SagB family peptide dehydrogenase n=1 Tax=Pseudalkalibacillus nanhaiensis TaxID=3115291 RepID=UPI0032D9F783